MITSTRPNACSARAIAWSASSFFVTSAATAMPLPPARSTAAAARPWSVRPLEQH